MTGRPTQIRLTDRDREQLATVRAWFENATMNQAIRSAIWLAAGAIRDIQKERMKLADAPLIDEYMAHVKAEPMYVKTPAPLKKPRRVVARRSSRGGSSRT